MSGIIIAKDVFKLIADIAFPILDEIEKDGFQSSDLLAFINTDDFKKDLSILIQDTFKKNQIL